MLADFAEQSTAAGVRGCVDAEIGHAWIAMWSVPGGAVRVVFAVLLAGCRMPNPAFQETDGGSGSIGESDSDSAISDSDSGETTAGATLPTTDGGSGSTSTGSSSDPTSDASDPTTDDSTTVTTEPTASDTEQVVCEWPLDPVPTLDIVQVSMNQLLRAACDEPLVVGDVKFVKAENSIIEYQLCAPQSNCVGCEGETYQIHLTLPPIDEKAYFPVFALSGECGKLEVNFDRPDGDLCAPTRLAISLAGEGQPDDKHPEFMASVGAFDPVDSVKSSNMKVAPELTQDCCDEACCEEPTAGTYSLTFVGVGIDYLEEEVPLVQGESVEADFYYGGKAARLKNYASFVTGACELPPQVAWVLNIIK